MNRFTKYREDLGRYAFKEDLYIGADNLANYVGQLEDRLEAIEKAEPREALQGVDVLYANAIDLTTENTKYLPEYLKPIRDKIKQTLLKDQKKEKAWEVVKEHLTFEERGTETYANKTKYIVRLESKDTGATIHIHLDTQQELELLKEMSK